jgi:hypothetical protein
MYFLYVKESVTFVWVRKHLVYKHLVYKHLVYKHLVYKHLVYKHLVYKHVHVLKYKYDGDVLIQR